jgi:protein-disulfide isomerase
LLVALLAGVLLALVGGTDTPASRRNRAAEREVAALLAGIPQQGDALGRPTAPVTLQVFSDLECLTAKGWWVGLLPAIIGRFVRSGAVRIEFRSFKTDTHDARTFLRQQAAAIAAGEQHRLWSFVETFYYEQGKEYTPYATERYLANIAAQVPGLQIARWVRDRRDGRLTERVVNDDKAVRELGFHDTPAFMIGRTGGPMRKLTGRHIVLQFPGYARMANPVSLIDARDLQQAVEGLRS